MTSARCRYIYLGDKKISKRRAKTMRRRIPQAAVFLALIAILAGCQMSSSLVPPTDISLQSYLILIVGGTQKLIPTVKPSNASTDGLVWSSADSAIATVDSNGTVAGVSEGQTTVTVATPYGREASCFILVVSVGVEKVSLDTNILTLHQNQTYTFTATITPEFATNKNVTWSTSDPSVVALVKNHAGKEDGTIFAKATGTADITVKTVDGNKTATCKVTVEP
jgi:uncharacterized protein YjdB